MSGTSPDNGSLSLLSCPSTGTTSRSSSVLQRNSKLYGPMNALKDDEQTCWNSDATNDSDPKVHYQLDFGRPVLVHRVDLQFQAGFTGEMLQVSIATANKNGETGIFQNVLEEEEELEDCHEFQHVTIDPPQRGHALKLVFREFTDFYGRVTIYRVRVWGNEVSV